MTIDDNLITKLTDLWMYVGCSDHHKDRDCHWYIEKRWSYGNAPTYTAQHWGYVYEPALCQPRQKYKDALQDLYNLLKQGLEYQFEGAKEAISDPTDWNNTEALDILSKEQEYRMIINEN